MHTTLEHAYLAALARHSRERADRAAACLPFLVDPHFRKSEGDSPAGSPMYPPPEGPGHSLPG